MNSIYNSCRIGVGVGGNDVKVEVIVSYKDGVVVDDCEKISDKIMNVLLGEIVEV